MPTIAELKAARAKHIDAMSALANLETLSDEQTTQYEAAKADAKKLEQQIERQVEVQKEAGKHALPVGGGTVGEVKRRPWAVVKENPYEKDPSLIVGALLKLAAMSKGNVYQSLDLAKTLYGENHLVFEAMGEAKALATSTGASGGFVVPPDFVAQIIPLLYARTVIRKAGARALPMPNGTMTLPKMTSGSSAYWVGEGRPIGESGPTFGQVVATAHKLAALVPVTNDMMRYASPQFDAKVRDDLVMQISLAEDAAGIRGAGTQFSPKGLRTFAAQFAANIIASTAVYTAATVNAELQTAMTLLETANIPMVKPVWLMAPRTKNYLYFLQNSLGAYVYRDEMKDGNLFNIPYLSTTQIPKNLTVGGNSDTSELYLVDIYSMMIMESRQLEFAVSTEGTYTDANGVLQSAFQNDMTLIRGLLAEDFQLDHDEAVVVVTGVRWGA